MGQYYIPIILEKNYQKNKRKKIKEFISPWDFDCGAKLMEHSYVNNPLVVLMEFKLFCDRKNVIWAGDYADDSIIIEKKKGPCSYTYYEYAGINGKLITNDNSAQEIIKEMRSLMEKPLILINFTKKLYIDIPKYDPEKLTIHPLPILTCDGNGRGGGDYSGTNMEYVGSWKGDFLGIFEKGTELEFPGKFEKLDIEFTEDR